MTTATQIKAYLFDGAVEAALVTTSILGILAWALLA